MILEKNHQVKHIKKAGVTTPEDLPTPEKSIKQLEKEELQRIGSNQIN